METLKKIWDKIPVSISELNYRDHSLFVAIMTGVIVFLGLQEYYVSAGCLSLVYVFRYFHRKKERTYHYIAASLGFAGLAFQSGIFFPIVLGICAYLINEIFKTKKQVFWFEMAAGIPYLFLI